MVLTPPSSSCHLLGGQKSSQEHLGIGYLPPSNLGKPVLLLDEPTSQMDERRSSEAAEMLLACVDSGGLMIASTRDPIFLEHADQTIRDQ